MLKRYLFILVLLSGFALLPLYSQQLLSKDEQIERLLESRDNYRNLLIESVSLNLKYQTDIDFWIGKSENLQAALKNQEELDKKKSKEYKLQSELWTKKEQELIKKSRAKQIKNGFIIGGVCVVVTAAIAVPVTIYFYDKINK